MEDVGDREGKRKVELREKTAMALYTVRQVVLGREVGTVCSSQVCSRICSRICSSQVWSRANGVGVGSRGGGCRWQAFGMLCEGGGRRRAMQDAGGAKKKSGGGAWGTPGQAWWG